MRSSKLLPLLATLMLAGSCHRPLPSATPVPNAAALRPVIIVPGITGTELVDTSTGNLAWGNGARLFRPRDGAYRFVLPPGGKDARPPLAAGRVIEKIRVGPIKTEIYGPLLRLLERHGYRRGDLAKPAPDATLFAFGYDWRLDNELTAQRLAKSLQTLRQARGNGPLEVDLICQSNGGHICRYVAKYGGSSFAEAAAGRAAPLEGITIRNLILVGTANGGSLRTLRELHRGRRYIPLVGRRMHPETLFSLPALYQDLPAPQLGPFFVDADGEPLDIDLYDATSWERHGWSIFAPEARRRASAAPELFGDPAGWSDVLAGHLDRARLLHELLDRDAPLGAEGYAIVCNHHEETAQHAAVLGGGSDPPQLLFPGDKELRKLPELAAKLHVLGDGHATSDSQLHLAPREESALIAEPFAIDAGSHFGLLLQEATLQRLLKILGGE